MRMPEWLTYRLFFWATEYRWRRKPDFIIRPNGKDYLERWWMLPRNKLFNIYLHQFYASDDDRALHDHPWFNVSLVLWGGYKEHLKDGTIKLRTRGHIVARSPWARHRIEMASGYFLPMTLFITGPRMRTWGFWCEQGFVPWMKFTDPKDKGKVGPGCDQPKEDARD